jgi:hypothetical protein
MLFYQRSSRRASENVSAEEMSPVVNQMISMVRSDNLHLMHNRQIFSQEYCDLMWKVVSMPFSLPEAGPSSATLRQLHADEDLQLAASQLAVSFVLGTLVHAKDRTQLAMWVGFLRKQVSSDCRVRSWFLETMAGTNCVWAQKLFLQSPVPEARAAALAIFMQVLSCVRPAAGTYNDHADGPPVSHVVKFMSNYVGLLPSAHRYWQNLMHYFQLLFEFASLGDAECEELLRQQLVLALLALHK